MGIILAKFRKEKSTYQILETLEERIKDIEAYTVSTQAQQKRYVGNFLVFSIGLYVIGFLVFYFMFFPPTWMERITYSVPLLIFPLLIFLIKRLVAWHFERKLTKNSKKLNTLRNEKKEIIEKVMDKETYKVALNILNRFSDQPAGSKLTPGALTPKTPLPNTNLTSQMITHSAQISRPTIAKTNQFITPTTSIQQSQSIRSKQLSQSASNLIDKTASRTLFTDHQIPSPQNIYQPQQTSLRPRTPFPIINQNAKGVFEKMVDYLIGDGPNNRYAMICKTCFGHNGMATPEEFQFAAFRCVYCNTLHPAQKLRPICPQLPTSVEQTTQVNAVAKSSSSSSTSSSTSERDSESEILMPVKDVEMKSHTKSVVEDDVIQQGKDSDINDEPIVPDEIKDDLQLKANEDKKND